MSFFLFYKIRKQEGRTGPTWGKLVLVGGEGGGERVKEGEYGTNTVDTCM
jgi:hypothetical protein